MKVRHLHFSEVRLTRFIEGIPIEQALDFGSFLKLGGSRNQITAFLKNSEKLEYDPKLKKWRRIETCSIVCSAE